MFDKTKKQKFEKSAPTVVLSWRCPYVLLLF